MMIAMAMVMLTKIFEEKENGEKSKDDDVSTDADNDYDDSNV